MERIWLIRVFCLSLVLLGILESQRLRTLNPFFRAERTIKLQNFTEVKKTLSPSDQELLELWESMLTGRVAPVSKWMKDRYKLLGLNHLFTPSGFHLSAVLYPVMKMIKNIKLQFYLLVLLGGALLFLPGQGALKRMIFIKSHQKILGLRCGFICALLLDCLFGTFQNNALSFTYSFLFLGIIYSGVEGIGLIFWFFVAQMVLSYFQGTQISPMLLLCSPILNFAFGISMPVLFILAIPLWSWQASIGIFILKILQFLVDISAKLIEALPLWEINIFALILIFCFVMRKRVSFLVGIFLFSSTLNWDQQKMPTTGKYDFRPMGEVVKTVSNSERLLIYFSDGKCERKLVRGFWFERCSPKRKSTHKKKQIMKLSSL